MKFLVDKLPDNCEECFCCYWEHDGGWQCRLCGYLKRNELNKQRSEYCPLSEFNKVFIGDGFVCKK